MVWSVDQDDQSFSALSGLLGKDIPSIQATRAESAVSNGKWASNSYQKCKQTDCLKDGQSGIWGSSWKMAPNGGPFKDNCGKGKNRYVSSVLLTCRCLLPEMRGC